MPDLSAPALQTLKLLLAVLEILSGPRLAGRLDHPIQDARSPVDTDSIEM